MNRKTFRIQAVFFLSFYKNLTNLSTYGCAGSLLQRAGAALSLQRPGFSLGWRGAGALGLTGFSSCGMRPQLPCAVWGPPGSGVEPTWPAWAGWFLTTRQPGESSASWLSSVPHWVLLAQLCNMKLDSKLFSFGTLGIPNRGPWRNTARLLCREDPHPSQVPAPRYDLSGAQQPAQRSGCGPQASPCPQPSSSLPSGKFLRCFWYGFCPSREVWIFILWGGVLNYLTVHSSSA